MSAIVPGCFNWLDADCNGIKINPVVTNQKELHPGSCTHHSFALIVETTYKIRWARNNDKRATQDLKVDLLWLLDEFPPPLKMRNLIIALNESKWKGTIKATDGHFHYKVRDSYCLTIGPGALNGVDDLDTVLEYLRDTGPVLGSFYPSPCYKPARNLVYVSDQQRQTVVCPECKRPLTVRHAVCVVGSVLASVNGELKSCFKYLESDNPEGNSTKKDGVCYMTHDSMHSVTIPIL